MIKGIVQHGIALALAGLSAAPASAQVGSPIDVEMYRNPALVFPKVELAFPKGAGKVWIAALDRPEADTRVAAAQSIALAHRQGMPGLAAAVEPLVRELDRAEQHPAVRLAAAHALIALDAKRAAGSLFRALERGDPELREAIEPALARWDYKPARALWLERLDRGTSLHRRELLAIESLVAVKETKAVPALQNWALSQTATASGRIAAARGLAELQTSGLEKDAAAQTLDSSPRGATSRLVAAMFLRRHNGAEAIKLLVGLAQDAEPAVAAVALARLVEIDVKLVVPLLPSILANPDAAVRGYGVETLFRQPSHDHLRLLGDRLNDPNPDVRERACQALHELAAKAEFREWVIREGERALAGRDWRGQEQGAILLGQLGHKPASKRMLEVLSVDRPEAFIAAAWGLRKLAAEDNLPAVLRYLDEQHEKLLKSGSNAGRRGTPPEAVDRQLSQLVQFLGQARYRPANDRLLKMLPRLVPGQPGSPPQSPVGVETRAAVAWALGLIHQDTGDAGLAKALVDRLTDLPVSPIGGENDLVRRTSAISLGRIKASDQLASLRRFHSAKPTLDAVDLSCGWAIARITGEPMTPPGIYRQPLAPWFLSSLD